ncbi:flagellar basal-body MS-ring/collar protein FliF [Orrella sp. JC864]|uniref:flagellar basal-body MS-ring/collar protein FliF n=1 Tax=Orrella sp. JC864 TaxID=3120298 RepID=UPI0012BD167C
MNEQVAATPAAAARWAPYLDKLRTLPKPALMGAGAALIALVVVAIMWTRGPEYRVLFSNLSERDGGAIVAALGQMNVPYKFADNGGALMVPANRVHETRLQLASQGLPRGGSVGFELLDNARFGASQFAEQISYQRGLEGELARSIEAMHSVQGARVHLAIPRQTLFVRERQSPTASVLVNLYPGRSLSDSQVSAIAWLVSSSVPQLTVDNVSIVDQTGRLLSSPAGAGRGMDADQLRYVREMEQRTVERILGLLNPLVGYGNVHAQATAEMDFSQREQTSEIYKPNQEPGQAAIRSQQTSDSQQVGVTPPQGVPGALSNQPPLNPVAPIQNPQNAQQGQNAQNQNGQAEQDGQAGAAQPAGPSNTRRDNTTNYELDRTISHVKQAVGTLNRLSVAVVINYRPDQDGVPQPLPQEELDKLTSLVREAMGYSEARGDSLNVANSLFNHAEPEIPLWRDPDNIALAKQLLWYLVVGLILLWLWRSIARPLLRRHLEPAVEAIAEGPEQAEIDRQAAAAAREQQLSRYEENLALARKMAQEDPRAVALVLRTWIEKDGKQ